MGRENSGVCVGYTGRAKPERDPSGNGEQSGAQQKDWGEHRKG